MTMCKCVSVSCVYVSIVSSWWCSTHVSLHVAISNKPFDGGLANSNITVPDRSLRICGRDGYLALSK